MSKRELALFSFIGLGRKTEDNQGYIKAKYHFKDTDEVRENAFFGASLVQELNSRKYRPDKWVVIGTPKSSWSEMVETMENEPTKDITEVWQKIFDQESSLKGVQDETLKDWNQLINETITGVNDLVFCSVNQLDFSIYTEILLNQLEPDVEYDIILDMTHGFRFMGTLMSFSIMMAKNIRKIDHINLYYGALDMKDGERELVPVLKIDFVNELAKLSEALSLYNNSGYSAPLLESLDYPKNHSEKLHFLLEMNRSARSDLNNALEHLENQRGYKKEISKLLNDDFSKMTGSTPLYERMIDKSKHFYQRKQYLKALILLYESLIVCGGRKFSNLKNFNKDKELNIKLEIKKRLTTEHGKTFNIIETVRNSVVHGSINNGNQKYLEQEKHFDRLYMDGLKVYEELNKLQDNKVNY